MEKQNQPEKAQVFLKVKKTLSWPFCESNMAGSPFKKKRKIRDKKLVLKVSLHWHEFFETLYIAYLSLKQKMY